MTEGLDWGQNASVNLAGGRRAIPTTKRKPHLSQSCPSDINVLEVVSVCLQA